MSEDELQEATARAVEDFEWTCSCGQPNLDAQWTKKGTVHGHCPACKQTIFWNDPEVFNPFDSRTPLGFEDDPGVQEKTTSNGDLTRCYPEWKVRRFIVKSDAEVRRGDEVVRYEAGQEQSDGQF